MSQAAKPMPFFQLPQRHGKFAPNQRVDVLVIFNCLDRLIYVLVFIINGINDTHKSDTNLQTSFNAASVSPR
jgi:hypothetical protein